MVSAPSAALSNSATPHAVDVGGERLEIEGAQQEGSGELLHPDGAPGKPVEAHMPSRASAEEQREDAHAGDEQSRVEVGAGKHRADEMRPYAVPRAQRQHDDGRSGSAMRAATMTSRVHAGDAGS